jgi:hypothetical protein
MEIKQKGKYGEERDLVEKEKENYRKMKEKEKNERKRGETGE